MKNVLILGGNGFIGKRLADILSQNSKMNVISFDKELPEEEKIGITYIQGDFFSEEDLAKALTDVNIVIHCICTIQPSTSNEKFLQAYSRDLVQTVKLCSSLAKRNIDMIFVSSGGTVYGNQEFFPIKEEAKLNPINHYGCLKVCIEQIINVFNVQQNTKFKIARLANPYGQGQNFNKGVGFIDAALKAALHNSEIVIWGDGEIVRDYIFIDDVCDALQSLIFYEGDQTVFNIGTGIGTSQNTILGYVKEIVGEVRVKYAESRGVDVKKNILDIDKISKLRDVPFTDLKSGINKYYQYLKEREINK